MRKANGLFNRVCEFVNSRPPGTTYKTSELTAWCKGYEHVTAHKRRNSNPFYRTLTYQTQLKYSGIVSHVKRGEWRVDLRIPDWFTTAHAETVAGYDMYVKRKDIQGNGHWIEVPRTKMTKAEILAGLLAYQTEKHADAWSNKSKAKRILTAMENAFTSTYNKDAFTATHSKGYYQDPLYYASGTYAKEGEANTNEAIYARLQKTEADALAAFELNANNAAAKAYRVAAAELYAQNEKDVANIDRIASILGLLKEIDFADPVKKAQVLNIASQVKGL